MLGEISKTVRGRKTLPREHVIRCQDVKLFLPKYFFFFFFFCFVRIWVFEFYHNSSLNCHNLIFKASALWANAFYKSKCPSVCLCVRVFTFEVPFKCLFAPISRSRMSNIFRDLECLGKSNGKKWSHIWTFLFESCLKSPRKKKVFFCWFCLTKHGGNYASRWIRDLWSKGVSLILAYL